MRAGRRRRSDTGSEAGKCSVRISDVGSGLVDEHRSRQLSCSCSMLRERDERSDSDPWFLDRFQSMSATDDYERDAAPEASPSTLSMNKC